jgi:3-hydroxybutyryl-CoA dehydrogenase
VVGLTMLAPPGTGRRVAVTRTAMVDARAARVVERLVARLEIAELAVDGRALARAEELVLAFLNRAVALAADGYASVEEIDTAMRLGCRLPIGPLELLDLCGLDSAHELMDLLHRRTGGRAHRPAPLLGGLVRSGAHGRKTRRGFHGYTAAGDRRPLGGGAGRPAPAASGLDTVGVLGSGTMARGIAETAATAGYPTVLVARDRGRAGAAVESIGASLLRAVRRGVITPGVRDRALALLRAGKDTLALAECDLVIEAVVEDIDVKRAVFGELDKVCAPSAVLATTTSSLPVIDCANATSRPADVVGLHFFNPVPAMRLVELVRTEHTRSTVLKTARMFCGSLGKTVVECGDRCGFIVNFLLFPYLNDAIALLEAGAASIPEIDAGIEQGFGFPMGPFALMDTIGLDVCLDILRGLNRAFPAVASPPNPLLGHLVAAGHTGRKTGGGFFNYER